MNKGDHITIYTSAYTSVSGYITAATNKAIELNNTWLPCCALYKKDGRIYLKRWFKDLKQT